MTDDLERFEIREHDDRPTGARPGALKPGQNTRGITVPRGVIYAQGGLLGAVAIGSFVLGMSLAGRTAPSEPQPRILQQCTITGTVHYVSETGHPVADAGAVVLLVPVDEVPGRYERAPATGLSPNELVPGSDDAAAGAIFAMGGAYARVDAAGKFRATVPWAGEFFLLAISRNMVRDPAEQLERTHLAELGRYVLPATELLGPAKYSWERVNTRPNAEFHITFR
jgi:hypothetical protein